ncbi:MAG: hypothetical protein RJA41_715 [Actinomycetota bacterium]
MLKNLQVEQGSTGLADSFSSHPSWQKLSKAIEALRPMQAKDGSIDFETSDLSQVKIFTDLIQEGISELTPVFAHQEPYLLQVQTDLKKWEQNGFQIPDFYDSLKLFRPDLDRIDGVLNLAVFSMYTQNGNLNRNLEAVITKTFWPAWLAEQEALYPNSAFVPIEFVTFTSGYDTNSAVLFPETVAVREVDDYKWGGIFCDREAARFRLVAKAACEAVQLEIPTDAQELINNQQLAQETFALWDLIHDRTHSTGDLPFDPFMIKQRLPYWLYGLEELRCDLSTFRETFILEKNGQKLAPYIRFAIVFDRIFRFPISGPRTKNYDGLGGQIIFSHLLRHKGLNWTNNKLTMDWELINELMVTLCEQVEQLYRDGINRSKVSQWLATYEFVSDLVEPHPASTWAKGQSHLPLQGEPRELVDLVLADEFPLNVFYESLSRKLKDALAQTKGITA